VVFVLQNLTKENHKQPPLQANKKEIEEIKDKKEEQERERP